MHKSEHARAGRRLVCALISSELEILDRAAALAKGEMERAGDGAEGGRERGREGNAGGRERARLSEQEGRFLS